MPCSHSRVLQRLVVQDATTLETEPWKTHIQRCPACQAERVAFDRSLAVFTQLESESRANVRGPSWEQFAATLQRSARERRRRRLHLAVSVAAAAMVMLTGGLVYTSVENVTPHPAKIVQLHPDLQHKLFRALQSSLEGDGLVSYAMSEPMSAERRMPDTAPVSFPSGVGYQATPVSLPPLHIDTNPAQRRRFARETGAPIPLSVPVMGASLSSEPSAAMQALNPRTGAAPGTGSSVAFPHPIR